MRYRYENFGGIIANDEPPFLAYVDRAFMRELGYPASSLWSGTDEEVGILSAPTEVHLAITNRCPNECPHCYMGSGGRDPAEMDTGTLKRALRELAEMGVFHVALGGGEALARPDLFEIAEYAGEVGLVPNLTVSGVLMTPEVAGRMTVFGQVNVSIDAIGDRYGVFRGRDMFEVADGALRMLVQAGVPAGINCVVGRSNFEDITALFAYAHGAGGNEIEFLRYKPAGRGASSYFKERTTFEQNTRLAPMLAELSEKHDIPAKVDCSFIPMLCWHNPPAEFLEASATYGCEAGNVLLGVRSDGSVSGCSFLEGEGLSVFDLQEAWTAARCFDGLRAWPEKAPEPCRSCEYLDICKGGCHAVALYVSGDMGSPDPDCPRVVRYHGEDK